MEHEINLARSIIFGTISNLINGKRESSESYIGTYIDSSNDDVTLLQKTNSDSFFNNSQNSRIDVNSNDSFFMSELEKTRNEINLLRSELIDLKPKISPKGMFNPTSDDSKSKEEILENVKFEQSGNSVQPKEPRIDHNMTRKQTKFSLITFLVKSGFKIAAVICFLAIIYALLVQRSNRQQFNNDSNGFKTSDSFEKNNVVSNVKHLKEYEEGGSVDTILDSSVVLQASLREKTLKLHKDEVDSTVVMKENLDTLSLDNISHVAILDTVSTTSIENLKSVETIVEGNKEIDDKLPKVTIGSETVIIPKKNKNRKFSHDETPQQHKIERKEIPVSEHQENLINIKPHENILENVAIINQSEIQKDVNNTALLKSDSYQLLNETKQVVKDEIVKVLDPLISFDNVEQINSIVVVEKELESDKINELQPNVINVIESDDFVAKNTENLVSMNTIYYESIRKDENIPESVSNDNLNNNNVIEDDDFIKQNPEIFDSLNPIYNDQILHKEKAVDSSDSDSEEVNKEDIKIINSKVLPNTKSNNVPNFTDQGFNDDLTMKQDFGLDNDMHLKVDTKIEDTQEKETEGGQHLKDEL